MHIREASAVNVNRHESLSIILALVTELLVSHRTIRITYHYAYKAYLLSSLSGWSEGFVDRFSITRNSMGYRYRQLPSVNVPLGKISNGSDKERQTNLKLS